VYSVGDLAAFTFSNGDPLNDAGDDIGVVDAWLRQGNKNMFLTGDNLASDLAQAGGSALDFLENYMGVLYMTSDVRELIHSQTSPLVAATALNPVFDGGLQSWIAYGGCVGINTFDAVEVNTGSLRIAEFLDPAGQSGTYPYSAATLASSVGLLGTSRVISTPYDLMYIYTDPAVPGNALPGRTLMLKDILSYFDVEGDPLVVAPVLPEVVFQAANYPNPFNPLTTFKYSLPRAGHLKLSVYNVRGQRVKTLIDGPRPAGADQTAVWDGTTNLGSAAASGLYFYEARTSGKVITGKMTLLR